MKKLVSLLLVLLCLSVLPAAACADGTVYSEGFFYYTVSDESITITGYFGKETEVTVPASIAGYPVNAIAPGAFSGTTATVIHLPDTIMAVGEGGTGSATVEFADDGANNARPTPPQGGTNSGGSSDSSASEPTNNGGSSGASTSTPPNSVSTTVTSSDVGYEEVTVYGDDDENESSAPIDTTIKEREGIVIATPDPNVTPEPTATPEPTPEATEAPAETPAAEKSGGAIGWIIGAVVLVCGGAAVVLLRKKGGKA